MARTGCGGDLRVAAFLRVALACLAGSSCRSEGPRTLRASAGEEWIGTRYPPLPREVVIARGTTLGTADTARFALAEVTAGRERLLWLGRRSGAAEATWIVMDALEMPEAAEGLWLMLGLCGTRQPGQSPSANREDILMDPEIVALARSDSQAVLTRVVHTWRANRATGRFETMVGVNVVCLNDREADG